jgi:hypothetical protein
MPQKGHKPLIMWMIKDVSGSILPMYGLHFTKKAAKDRLTEKAYYNWEKLKSYGWLIVKVKITEHATERTDNR